MKLLYALLRIRFFLAAQVCGKNNELVGKIFSTGIIPLSQLNLEYTDKKKCSK